MITTIRFPAYVSVAISAVLGAAFAEEPDPRTALRILGESALMNGEPIQSINSNGVDGGVLVVGETGSVARWELTASKRAWTRPGNDRRLISTDIAWSADASRIAFRRSMFSIEVQDAITGRKVGAIEDESIGFSLSPRGDRLLSVRYANTMGLFDVENGTRLLEVGNEAEGVSKEDAMVLIDDHRALSTSLAGTMRLLDLSEPAKSRVIGQEGCMCWAFRLSRDGKQVVWTTETRRVRLAALDAAEVRGRDVLTTPHRVVDLEFSADGRELAILQFDGTLNLGDPSSPDSFLSVRVAATNSVRFADKDTLVLTGIGSRLRRIQRRDGKLIEISQGHGGEIVDIAWGPDGLATLGSDSTICRWDADSARLLDRVEVPSGDELLGALSPAGDLWAILDRAEGGRPSQIRYFTQDGRRATLSRTSPLLGLTSPDGNYSIDIQRGNAMTLVSLDRGSPPQDWNPREISSEQETDAWTPAWVFGSLFVAAHCESRKVRLFSVPSLRPAGEFDTGLDPVSHTMTAYSPGGLVALSIADNLFIYEIWSGKQVARLTPDSGEAHVHGVTFLQDGLRVAFVRGDKSIAIFDIASETLHVLAKAADLPGPPRRLMSSPDAKTLAACLSDGRIVLVPLPNILRPAEPILNDQPSVVAIAASLRKEAPREARAPLTLLATATVEFLQRVAEELASPPVPDEADLVALGGQLAADEPEVRRSARAKLCEIATRNVVAVRKLGDSLSDPEARAQVQNALFDAEATWPKDARELGILRFCEAIRFRGVSDRTKLIDRLQASRRSAFVDRVLLSLR